MSNILGGYFIFCSYRLNYPFIFQETNLLDFYMQVCKTEVTTTRSTLYSHTLLYAMKKHSHKAIATASCDKQIR